MTGSDGVILRCWAGRILLEDTHADIILSFSDSVRSGDLCLSGCLGNLPALLSIRLPLPPSRYRYDRLNGANYGDILGSCECILSSA